ncbi:MAG: hypothetical protein LC667_05235 [Thioalkalivibrio sp.]|nr:hypothetical protein [Thioalkalivibrio sp.]
MEPYVVVGAFRDPRCPPLEPPTPSLEPMMGVATLPTFQSVDSVILAVRCRDHDPNRAEHPKDGSLERRETRWLQVLQDLHERRRIDRTQVRRRIGWLALRLDSVKITAAGRGFASALRSQGSFLGTCGKGAL